MRRFPRIFTYVPSVVGKTPVFLCAPQRFSKNHISGKFNSNLQVLWRCPLTPQPWIAYRKHGFQIRTNDLRNNIAASFPSRPKMGFTFAKAPYCVIYRLPKDNSLNLRSLPEWPGHLCLTANPKPSAVEEPPVCFFIQPQPHACLATHGQELEGAKT